MIVISSLTAEDRRNSARLAVTNKRGRTGPRLITIQATISKAYDGQHEFAAWVYFDRTSRRHRDHCNSGEPAPSRALQSQNTRTQHPMHQQSPAECDWLEGGGGFG